MNKSLILTILLLAPIFSARVFSQEKQHIITVKNHIREVENNLNGWVRTGSKVCYWKLSDRMKYYGVKGLSIAVIKNYHIEWAKGYGWADEAAKQPVTTRTLFQAGSISKSLNAVGVIELAQSGKLDLNVDINRYLKTWKFPYDSLAHGQIITPLNLLSHTAGLNVHGFPGYAIGDSLPNIYQVLDGKLPANTEAVRSVKEPGKSYLYSGGGTIIAQLIVMDITGQSYENFMWQKVLQPLGMLNSTFEQPPATSNGVSLASGYLAGGKSVKGKYHLYPEQAAAGLWTNPTDLAKYVIETQRSYEGYSSKVLTPLNIRMLLNPYIDTNSALSVLNFKKGNRRYFTYNGADCGFMSLYYGSLSGGDGVVIMINSDAAYPIISELLYSVAKVYRWKGFRQTEFRKTVPIPVASIGKFCGTYALEGDTLTLQKKGTELYFSSNNMSSDHEETVSFQSAISFFVYEEGPRTFRLSNQYGKQSSIVVHVKGKPDQVYHRLPEIVKFPTFVN